jgi:hypothetical protein
MSKKEGNIDIHRVVTHKKPNRIFEGLYGIVAE